MTETEESARDNLDARTGQEGDYYAILGISARARHEEIHQAYRRLAKLWHPDRYTYAPPDLRDRAERRMRAISRAWTELGDPIRRRAYDQRHADVSWMSDFPQATQPSQASNGAGMFVGMLCVILALPLLINLLSGGLHETWQVMVASVALLVLSALAGLFFVNDSPMAHLANSWAEGEPRGFHEQPVAQHSSPPRFTFEVDDDADADAAGSRAFELLVEQALATIPEDFKPFMRNVLVRVEREPTDEELRRMEVGPHGTLFGLYTGVPLTSQGAHAVNTEIVTIYRGPIERYCQGDPARIREQVRRTVLHEVAHHFGIDHDDMPDWLK